MRHTLPCGILALSVLLGGCGEAGDGRSPPLRHGRYAGIGTYPADRLWSRIAAADKPADAAAATVEDDGQIIVVVDSHTGEIRQCGNLSGYCIGMHPWAGATRAAPARLTAHAVDVARETEEGQDAELVGNAAAPSKTESR